MSLFSIFGRVLQSHCGQAELCEVKVTVKRDSVVEQNKCDHRCRRPRTLVFWTLLLTRLPFAWHFPPPFSARFDATPLKARSFEQISLFSALVMCDDCTDTFVCEPSNIFLRFPFFFAVRHKCGGVVIFSRAQDRNTCLQH